MPMEGTGHDSERAALNYLHSPAERRRHLADAVGDTARTELTKSEQQKTSSLGARRGTKPPSARGGC